MRRTAGMDIRNGLSVARKSSDAIAFASYWKKAPKLGEIAFTSWPLPWRYLRHAESRHRNRTRRRAWQGPCARLLRELERDCLVTRTVFQEVPPRVEYALTEWGVSLNKALGPIANWGEAFAQGTGRYPIQDAAESVATARAKTGSPTKPKTVRGRRGS